MSRPLIVIPARIGSTRLKNKPLREIGGVPLITHVCRRALEADIGLVCLSSDDVGVLECAPKGIAKLHATGFPEHCGTDRVAHFVQVEVGRKDDFYVINLQGDLPFIDPQIIRDLWAKRRESTAQLITAYHKRPFVGLTRNCYRYAYRHKGNEEHIGIYAYTAKSLREFAAMPQTREEIRTNLEMRRLDNTGWLVDYIVVDHMPLEINTESDLAHANLIASMLRRAEDTGSGNGWAESHPGPDDGGF